MPISITPYGGRLELRQDDNSTFYLDGWTDFQSRVDWLVRIDKPGIFDIYAEVVAEESVSFLLMANDGQNLTIKSSGGKTDFSNPAHRPIDLVRRGIHDRDASANVTLNPIMLRPVTLKPAENNLIRYFGV